MQRLLQTQKFNDIVEKVLDYSTLSCSKDQPFAVLKRIFSCPKGKKDAKCIYQEGMSILEFPPTCFNRKSQLVSNEVISLRTALTSGIVDYLFCDGNNFADVEVEILEHEKRSAVLRVQLVGFFSPRFRG